MNIQNIFKTAMVGIALLLNSASCSKAQNTDNQKTDSNNKVLVAYFSASGVTEEAAQTLAEATGGKLYEIQPAKEYTAADLDWHDQASRSSVEMHNPKARTELKEKCADIKNYDTIYIGFPIWWDLAPRIINTFIESHDLTGKTIIPFATSGGSSIANSEKELRSTYPNLKWKTGKLLNGMSLDDMKQWTKQ